MVMNTPEKTELSMFYVHVQVVSYSLYNTLSQK